MPSPASSFLWMSSVSRQVRATEFGDLDAFHGTPLGLGILDIIYHTGLFDQVNFAAEPEVNRSTSDLDAVATVVPRPAREFPEGVQSYIRRQVPYQVVLEVAEAYADFAYRRLDEIESAVILALTDGTNRAYGGFCVPWLSKIQRDEYNSRRVPGRRRVLVGEFTYHINLRREVL